MNRAIVVRVIFLLAATFQTLIFGYFGYSEHSYSVANSKRRAQSFEHFYCIELKRSYLIADEGFGECYAPVQQRYVVLTNLPVFLVSVPATLLIGPKLKISQVILFYGLNAVGIPLFWYGVGAMISKRVAKKTGGHT